MIIIKQKERDKEQRERERRKIYICTIAQEREGRFISFVLYEDEKKQTSLSLSIAIVSHLFIGTTGSKTRDTHRVFFLFSSSSSFEIKQPRWLIIIIV